MGINPDVSNFKLFLIELLLVAFSLFTKKKFKVYSTKPERLKTAIKDASRNCPPPFSNIMYKRDLTTCFMAARMDPSQNMAPLLSKYYPFYGCCEDKSENNYRNIVS